MKVKKLYEWNGVNAWVEVAPKLGAETIIYSLAVYNGKLYGGTYANGVAFGEVELCDFCGVQENRKLDECPICGRKMCYRCLATVQAGYSVSVCKVCVKRIDLESIRDRYAGKFEDLSRHLSKEISALKGKD